jgi:Ca2+/H+ antiporter
MCVCVSRHYVCMCVCIYTLHLHTHTYTHTHTYIHTHTHTHTHTQSRFLAAHPSLHQRPARALAALLGRLRVRPERVAPQPVPGVCVCVCEVDECMYISQPRCTHTHTHTQTHRWGCQTWPASSPSSLVSEPLCSAEGSAPTYVVCVCVCV